MDYLRRKGLKVGQAYEKRLLSLRRKEVRRVLDGCMLFGGIDQWPTAIDILLDESYLYDWFKGLYIDAGLPRAQSTARDLSRGKASLQDDTWKSILSRYGEERAGSEIVLVSGTMKEELIKITRNVMYEDSQLPIEKLAYQIFKKYKEIELWQARRIAQTETMIGLAEAGDMAARTLDVGFTKQWAISGLGNTRDTHEVMDGAEVDEDEPFQLPDCLMMYPHDGSMGAPAGEIINCACDCIRRPK